MPGAAYELGAAEALVPLERVPEALLQALDTQPRSSLPLRLSGAARATNPDDPPSGQH